MVSSGWSTASGRDAEVQRRDWLAQFDQQVIGTMSKASIPLGDAIGCGVELLAALASNGSSSPRSRRIARHDLDEPGIHGSAELPRLAIMRARGLAKWSKN